MALRARAGLTFNYTSTRNLGSFHRHSTSKAREGKARQGEEGRGGKGEVSFWDSRHMVQRLGPHHEQGRPYAAPDCPLERMGWDGMAMVASACASASSKASWSYLLSTLHSPLPYGCAAAFSSPSFLPSSPALPCSFPFHLPSCLLLYCVLACHVPCSETIAPLLYHSNVPTYSSTYKPPCHHFILVWFPRLINYPLSPFVPMGSHTLFQ